MSKNTNLSFLTDYITADITNGRIGINNASPAYAFDVTGIARTSTSTYLATASGNVGIGTTSPFYPLSLGDNYADAGTMTSGGNFYGTAYFGKGGLTVGVQSTTNHIALMSNTSGKDIIFGGWNGSTNTERMRITSAGNINLYDQKHQLAFYGASNFQINFGQYYNGTSQIATNTDGGRLIMVDGGFKFNTFTGGTVNSTVADSERMRIKSDGQVIIGDTSMLYTNADGHPFGVKSTSSQCFISLAYAGQTLASGGLSVGITGAAAYYFVRDYVPIIFATGNNERMRMLANGNLSLGTTSDVGAKIYIVSSTSYGIVYQNSSNTNNFYVGVGGDGYLRASAWSYGSDIRMKENISDVTNGLDLVSKLKPKHFDYINGAKDNLGFIAQEVQELIPQAVTISDEKTGMLGLKTDFIIPYLVKSIQELSAEITILKNK